MRSFVCAFQYWIMRQEVALFTKAKVIIVQSTKKEAALCLTCLECMLGKLTQFEDKSLSASL